MSQAVEVGQLIRKGLVSIIGFDVMGHQAEVALVGREGGIGISLAFGRSTGEAVTACTVDEISSEEFLSLCEQHPVFLNTMMRHEHERMSQIMAFSALGAKLRLKERLSAWLLVATDRLGDDGIQITLLGVRRPSIEALHVLEGEGVVTSRRCALIVRDREKLERTVRLAAC